MVEKVRTTHIICIHEALEAKDASLADEEDQITTEINKMFDEIIQYVQVSANFKQSIFDYS